jgi:hypothetical protein
MKRVEVWEKHADLWRQAGQVGKLIDGQERYVASSDTARMCRQADKDGMEPIINCKSLQKIWGFPAERAVPIAKGHSIRRTRAVLFDRSRGNRHWCTGGSGTDKSHIKTCIILLISKVNRPKSAAKVSSPWIAGQDDGIPINLHDWGTPQQLKTRSSTARGL